MQTSTGRTIGALLLSLLIAIPFLATGSWCCADGRACMPALAAVCCYGCGTEEIGVERAQAQSGPRSGSALGRARCGCYRDLNTNASHCSSVRVVLTAPALLPPSGVVFAPPTLRLVSLLSLPGARAPNRFCLSPGDTRAPPAA